VYWFSVLPVKGFADWVLDREGRSVQAGLEGRGCHKRGALGVAVRCGNSNSLDQKIDKQVPNCSILPMSSKR